MNRAFLRHQWLAFWRSKNTSKSIIVSILLALAMLYLFANLLIASFFLDKILDKAFPEDDVQDAFNGLLLYYFLADLLMRFQLQELPTLAVKPYLNLPVSRNKIVNYLSLTSLWSGFNLSPFLLTVPFLIKVLWLEGQHSAFAGLLISIVGLTLFNHFFSLWLKRKFNMNAWFMLAFLFTLAGIVLVDFYSNSISISNFSRYLFNSVIKFPFFSFLLIFLGGLMYLINRSFLKNNLYLDELRTARPGQNTTGEVPILRRFGIPGELAALEVKLILRNKRPKSTLVMSGIFMLYGLLFYRHREPDEMIMIVAGMMMTGIFIINYGQFMFSWQSAHFDGILANKISAEDFFKSKFILFTLFATITLILTAPYAYFGWKILLTHCMLYLWNIGVSSLIVLAFANWNYKYIDLSKGSSFNWEGIGASQFIIGIPLFVIPMLIYILIGWLSNPIAGTLSLGFIGMIFILTRQYWIGKLVRSFKSKRYKIAEGFREH